MTHIVQVSLEALGALVLPEEREKAIRGAGRSETEVAFEEEADIETEVNEKVIKLIQLHSLSSPLQRDP